MLQLVKQTNFSDRIVYAAKSPLAWNYELTQKIEGAKKHSWESLKLYYQVLPEQAGIIFRGKKCMVWHFKCLIEQLIMTKGLYHTGMLRRTHMRELYLMAVLLNVFLPIHLACQTGKCTINSITD